MNNIRMYIISFNTTRDLAIFEQKRDGSFRPLGSMLERWSIQAIHWRGKQYRVPRVPTRRVPRGQLDFQAAGNHGVGFFNFQILLDYCAFRVGICADRCAFLRSDCCKSSCSFLILSCCVSAIIDTYGEGG